MTPEYLKQAATLREGETNGNGMVLRLVTHDDTVIHAIAVPQDGHSYTGPTWCYVFEEGGLNVIDPGSFGSYNTLVGGLELAGYQPRQVRRIIISHGHPDHDGCVSQLAAESGGEVWAHEVYAALHIFDHREMQMRPTSPIKAELFRVAQAHRVGPPSAAWRARYMEAKRRLTVHHPIRNGERLGRLTFYHLPGHSPDELAITFGGLIFTGDHVLPEISPHPSMTTQFTPDMRNTLPPQFHDERRLFGLLTYLRSLERTVALGRHLGMLPAHRLHNRAKFNFLTLQRAADIADHHVERLQQILDMLGPDAAELEDTTRRLFAHRTLDGMVLFAAMTETVAHLEVLEQAGDLAITEAGRALRSGSRHYRQLTAPQTLAAT